MNKSLNEQISDMKNDPELNAKNTSEAKEEWLKKNNPIPFYNPIPFWRIVWPKEHTDKAWNFVTFTGGTIWVLTLESIWNGQPIPNWLLNSLLLYWNGLLNFLLL